jgi:monovalent cation/hydrogen antiporter
VAALELVLVLLVACMALQVLARRFGIPQPALLVLGGAVLALVPGLPRPGLDPAVIFLVFVPPLLFFASVTAPLRELGNQFWPILQLSVPLVLVTMTVVAVAAHALTPQFTWPAAFALGAIVSAPDPIAAVAVMRPLRAPGGLTALLEGEGMFNDVTALVAYRIAVAAAVTGTFSLWQAGVEFAWSGALGLAVGLLVGRAIIAIRRRLHDLPLVDNTVSLLSPFVAYLPADALGASGILAVVAAGIYIGRRLATALSPATRVQAITTWRLVAFVLENLVFVLIGLELRYVIHESRPNSLGALLAFGAAISLVVILIRIVWVLLGAALRGLAVRRWGPGSRKRAALVAWTGVRGADAVVIALALPHFTASGVEFPARDLIIFITFGVVFATLVLQGLTIRPLLHWLGLEGDIESVREEAHARHVLAAEGLRRLEELGGTNEYPPELVDQLRQRHQHRASQWATRERRLGGEPADPHDLDRADEGQAKTHFLGYRELRSEMIDAERAEVVELSDRGVIGADVLRRIERDLDFEALLLGDPPPDGQDPDPAARAASQ